MHFDNSDMVLIKIQISFPLTTWVMNDTNYGNNDSEFKNLPSFGAQASRFLQVGVAVTQENPQQTRIIHILSAGFCRHII